MMGAEQTIIEAAYFEAINTLVGVVGYKQFNREPTVDLDKVPAATAHAARVAIETLMIGMSIMDDDSPACETDADDFLARITGGGS